MMRFMKRGMQGIGAALLGLLAISAAHAQGIPTPSFDMGTPFCNDRVRMDTPWQSGVAEGDIYTVEVRNKTTTAITVSVWWIGTPRSNLKHVEPAPYTIPGNGKLGIVFAYAAPPPPFTPGVIPAIASMLTRNLEVRCAN